MPLPCFARVGASYTPEATALFNRFAGTYSASRRSAINTLIVTLKTAGLWTTFDALYVLAANVQADGLLNWVSTSYNLSLGGSVTFTTDRGILFNPSYASTGFVPSTAGGKYSLNSATIFTYRRTSNSTGVSDIGTAIGSYSFIAPNNGSASYYEVNDGASASRGAGSSTLGLYTATRTASNQFIVYRNKVSFLTANTNSTSLPTGQIFVGSETAGSSCNNQIACAGIASGWTNQQQSDFYDAIQAYMTELGANV